MRSSNCIFEVSWPCTFKGSEKLFGVQFHFRNTTVDLNLKGLDDEMDWNFVYMHG
jgi:hypothetical protein